MTDALEPDPDPPDLGPCPDCGEQDWDILDDSSATAACGPCGLVILSSVEGSDD